MAKKNKEVVDKTRNNIFAAAADELRRNHGITTQLELAAKMGVSKDTITNIMHYRTEVTEDIISKLQTASGCIFNLQWLRGESDIMLAEDAKNSSEPSVAEQKEPQNTPTLQAVIDAKDQSIMFLQYQIKLVEETAREQLEEKERMITSKDETISAKDKTIASLDALIENLQAKVDELQSRLGAYENGNSLKDYPFPIGVAEDDGKMFAKKV